MQTVPLPCSSARTHWAVLHLLLGTFRAATWEPQPHHRAQWISGVAHKEPSLTASQNADAACPPWASSRWSLSPASIPLARSPASPQPHLPSWGQGQREAGAGAGSDSAQGQLLTLALGAG